MVSTCVENGKLFIRNRTDYGAKRVKQAPHIVGVDEVSAGLLKRQSIGKVKRQAQGQEYNHVYLKPGSAPGTGFY